MDMIPPSKQQQAGRVGGLFVVVSKVSICFRRVFLCFKSFHTHNLDAALQIERCRFVGRKVQVCGTKGVGLWDEVYM